MGSSVVALFLCGDVMLGRGVDQILRYPGDPTLREQVVRDAREYVWLAESVNGPIPTPVDDSWPWGDVPATVARADPAARIVNLETSVTSGGAFDLAKSINYRMNPANIGCLAAIAPDACVLANNHVLDFGQSGLLDTLDVLATAGIATAGAGRDRAAAWQPVPVPIQGGGRVLVFGLATGSSGVPAAWAAGDDRPGVAYLPDLRTGAVEVADALRTQRRPGDIAVISIHWGSNWGYDVSAGQVAFAHQVIDAGADIVHGHSSHHPRPVEIYRDRLILYGCGDLINDYEGIDGHDEYRSELRVVYLPTVDARTGELLAARLVPMRAAQLRLWRAPAQDGRWLRSVLADRSTGCRIDAEADGSLIVTPADR